MKIFFINHHGGGFADYVEVAEGTTVEQFFMKRIPQGDPANYLIRVDRQLAAADEVLREGQRVSFTPTKIEGALTGWTVRALGGCAVVTDHREDRPTYLAVSAPN